MKKFLIKYGESGSFNTFSRVATAENEDIARDMFRHVEEASKLDPPTVELVSIEEIK